MGSPWKQKTCWRIPEENSDKKNLDMIVANNLKDKGAGFGVDTNLITIITRDRELQLELMSKQDAANCILDEIIRKIGNRE